MQKPDVDLETLSLGKIFQISPEGKDDVQVRYGGDFLIATEYFEWGVMGYLANVYEHPGISRYKGVAYIRVGWAFIECVGSSFWFRKDEMEEKDGKSDSNKD